MSGQPFNIVIKLSSLKQHKSEATNEQRNTDSANTQEKHPHKNNTTGTTTDMHTTRGTSGEQPAGTTRGKALPS